MYATHCTLHHAVRRCQLAAPISLSAPQVGIGVVNKSTYTRIVLESTTNNLDEKMLHTQHGQVYIYTHPLSTRI